ncbi:MAG TPA: biopolymer transporter ExbD [Verrucomicrobiae bacterium]|jgi:biopolymer transport protein ExbD|nr:biopolymer transporter ExbD [Verrucomicrobiae bacterium]
MKFPRNARIFRGQLDAAPFAAVFFLLVIFVLLGSMLYPGIRIDLSSSSNLLSGTQGATLSVAVTTNAIYYGNQLVSENEFSNHLNAAARNFSEPLTLIVQADKEVTEEKIIHLKVLAEQAGVSGFVLATLPRLFDSPGPGKIQP